MLALRVVRGLATAPPCVLSALEHLLLELAVGVAGAFAPAAVPAAAVAAPDTAVAVPAATSEPAAGAMSVAPASA